MMLKDCKYKLVLEIKSCQASSIYRWMVPKGDAGSQERCKCTAIRSIDKGIPCMAFAVQVFTDAKLGSPSTVAGVCKIPVIKTVDVE